MTRRCALCLRSARSCSLQAIGEAQCYQHLLGSVCRVLKPAIEGTWLVCRCLPCLFLLLLALMLVLIFFVFAPKSECVPHLELEPIKGVRCAKCRRTFHTLFEHSTSQGLHCASFVNDTRVRGSYGSTLFVGLSATWSCVADWLAVKLQPDDTICDVCVYELVDAGRLQLEGGLSSAQWCTDCRQD